MREEEGKRREKGLQAFYWAVVQLSGSEAESILALEIVTMLVTGLLGATKPWGAGIFLHLPCPNCHSFWKTESQLTPG